MILYSKIQKQDLDEIDNNLELFKKYNKFFKKDDYDTVMKMYFESIFYLLNEISNQYETSEPNISSKWDNIKWKDRSTALNREWDTHPEHDDLIKYFNLKFIIQTNVDKLDKTIYNGTRNMKISEDINRYILIGIKLSEKLATLGKEKNYFSKSIFNIKLILNDINIDSDLKQTKICIPDVLFSINLPVSKIKKKFEAAGDKETWTTNVINPWNGIIKDFVVIQSTMTIKGYDLNNIPDNLSTNEKQMYIFITNIIKYYNTKYNFIEETEIETDNNVFKKKYSNYIFNNMILDFFKKNHNYIVNNMLNPNIILNTIKNTIEQHINSICVWDTLSMSNMKNDDTLFGWKNNKLAQNARYKKPIIVGNIYFNSGQFNQKIHNPFSELLKYINNGLYPYEPQVKLTQDLLRSHSKFRTNNTLILYLMQITKFLIEQYVSICTFLNKDRTKLASGRSHKIGSGKDERELADATVGSKKYKEDKSYYLDYNIYIKQNLSAGCLLENDTEKQILNKFIDYPNKIKDKKLSQRLLNRELNSYKVSNQMTACEMTIMNRLEYIRYCNTMFNHNNYIGNSRNFLCSITGLSDMCYTFNTQCAWGNPNDDSDEDDNTKTIMQQLVTSVYDDKDIKVQLLSQCEGINLLYNFVLDIRQKQPISSGERQRRSWMGMFYHSKDSNLLSSISNNFDIIFGAIGASYLDLRGCDEACLSQSYRNYLQDNEVILPPYQIQVELPPSYTERVESLNDQLNNAETINDRNRIERDIFLLNENISNNVSAGSDILQSILSSNTEPSASPLYESIVNEDITGESSDSDISLNCLIENILYTLDTNIVIDTLIDTYPEFKDFLVKFENFNTTIAPINATKYSIKYNLIIFSLQWYEKQWDTTNFRITNIRDSGEMERKGKECSNSEKFNPTNISQLWSGNPSDNNKWAKKIQKFELRRGQNDRITRQGTSYSHSILESAKIQRYKINKTNVEFGSDPSSVVTEIDWKILLDLFQGVHDRSLKKIASYNINDLFDLVLSAAIECKLSFDKLPKVNGPVHWGNDVCDLWTMLFYIYGNKNSNSSIIKYSTKDQNGRTLPKLNNNVKKVFKYCGRGGGKKTKGFNQNYISNNYFEYYDLIQIISNWGADDTTEFKIVDFLQHIENISGGKDSIIYKYIKNGTGYNLNDIIFRASEILREKWEQVGHLIGINPDWKQKWKSDESISHSDENASTFIYRKLINIYIWCEEIKSLKIALETSDIPTYSLKLLYHYLIPAKHDGSVFGKKESAHDNKLLIIHAPQDRGLYCTTYNMNGGDSEKQNNTGTIVYVWYAWLDTYSLVYTDDQDGDGAKVFKPLYTSISFAPVPYFIPLLKYFKYYETFNSWMNNTMSLTIDGEREYTVSKFISYIVLVLRGGGGVDLTQFNSLWENGSVNHQVIQAIDNNNRLKYLLKRTVLHKARANNRLCLPEKCTTEPQERRASEAVEIGESELALVSDALVTGVEIAGDILGIGVGGVGGGRNNNSSKKKVFKLKSKKGKTTYKRKKYHASSIRNTRRSK